VRKIFVNRSAAAPLFEGQLAPLVEFGIFSFGMGNVVVLASAVAEAHAAEMVRSAALDFLAAACHFRRVAHTTNGIVQLGAGDGLLEFIKLRVLVGILNRVRFGRFFARGGGRRGGRLEVLFREARQPGHIPKVHLVESGVKIRSLDQSRVSGTREFPSRLEPRSNSELDKTHKAGRTQDDVLALQACR
jgi:hypothetical protein